MRRVLTLTQQANIQRQHEAGAEVRDLARAHGVSAQTIYRAIRRTDERDGESIPAPETDDWRDRAACRGTNPDIFYPSDSSPEGAEMARRICDSCTVREPCLAYALATNQTDGIWAGTSDRQRRRIRSQRRQVSA